MSEAFGGHDFLSISKKNSENMPPLPPVTIKPHGSPQKQYGFNPNAGHAVQSPEPV